jgi:dihydropteroate synthase
MTTTMAMKRDRFLAEIGKRSLVMGILNITPDSFSDGGEFLARDAALARARKLCAEGADILDIGAESTRPGHQPVPEEEERARLEPVLADLVATVDLPVSIDTTKSSVARFAIGAGASVVNDVWGLQKDPAMAETVAETGAAVVVMHNRTKAEPEIDILDDMRRFFDTSLQLADKAGIPHRYILLDPGIGFGKSRQQNFEALAGLPRLKAFGLPILVGVSRKSLLADLAGPSVDARLVATLAANLGAAARGAGIFRVHDVAEHVAAFRVFDTIEAAAPAGARP